MTRRMLINAQRPEEVRVATVAGDTLEGYQVAVAEAGLLRGNIYRGIVANLQPALDAAFVDFGLPKHGFLAGDDVVREAAHRTPPAGKRPRVEQLLERGKPVLVQVTKDPAGEKGAALTTKVSLAGRYLVLTPFDEMRGISRKVEDEATRGELRALADKLTVPEGCGIIVRTNALGQNKTALNRDLAALTRLWKRIGAEFKRGKGPLLLHSDQDLIIQAIRDLLDPATDEVLVDDDEAFEKARDAMQAFMPRAKVSLVRYRERLPLFSRFGVEEQIEGIFKPTVPLPSGGSIVIEGTQALTAIDVNSGRSTRAASNEETYFHTNQEAAREVARQLRLRDIGGLIVVDLIDMRSHGHRREVEKALREAVKSDRARTWVGRISENGLVEINRQRLKTPLVQRTHRVCPTCGGGGRIPSPETVSLSLLRRVEERAASGGIGGVRVALHPELADALQNHYRSELAALEREFAIRIEIVAAAGFHRSQEEVEWRPREAAEPAPSPGRAAGVGVAASGGAAPVTTGGETAEPRPRRRRRGGRRHRKGAGAQPDEPAASSAVLQEPPDDAEVAAAPAATAARKRRRRRRGKKAQGGAAAEAATASA